MIKFDKQYILRLQNKLAYARDEQAYKELFYYFHPRLHNFIKGITKSGTDADEIVSDVMLKLWHMKNRIAYIENLEVYLFKAAKNTAFNLLSARKREKESLADYHSKMPADAENNDRLLVSETEKLIQTSIQALPPQCQVVFRLIKEEGFSYKQVSEVLEVSQNTIETHMRIALKRIRVALHHYLNS